MRMSAMPRSSESLCVAVYIFKLLIVFKCSAFALTTTPTAREYNYLNDAAGLPLLRFIGRSLTHCLATAERWKCLEEQLTRGIEVLAHDNNTWQYGDFIIIEQVASNSSDGLEGQSIIQKQRAQRQRSLQANDSEFLKGSFAASLLHLAKSRSIRLQLPSSPHVLNQIGAGISNAIDGFDLTETPAAGEVAYTDEGRKKKDKDKNMAMVGGVAMMAMVAQMFLGKVILIAGAAFVMAKIALLVSVLGSLKKESAGSSGSTEHIIVTSPAHGKGGGHDHAHSDLSYETGWHRSMPHIYTETEIMSEEPKDTEKYYHTPPQPPTPPTQYATSSQLNEGFASEVNKAVNYNAGEGYRRKPAQTQFL